MKAGSEGQPDPPLQEDGWRHTELSQDEQGEGGGTVSASFPTNTKLLGLLLRQEHGQVTGKQF